MVEVAPSAGQRVTLDISDLIQTKAAYACFLFHLFNNYVLLIIDR